MCEKSNIKSSQYRIVPNGVTVTLFKNLRKTGPFLEYEDEDIEVALKNTIYSIAIFDDDKPIGIARIVGDGRIVFFIKDVVIVPEYRGQGIGRLIMGELFKYIENHACYNAYICLMATVGTEEFYEKFGFIRRPNQDFGAGMIMYYKGGKIYEEDRRVW